MIALLGYGKTNQALLSYINAQGMRCVVCDDSFERERVDGFGNIFTQELGSHTTELQIPSPGIPPYHKNIALCHNLVSEYDFILHSLSPNQVWISGTNGKTTTTEMLEFILQDFGAKSGGNIGIPLATLAQSNPKIWVLETSSFSLHYTKVAYPHCYILLPLSEDHISWHGSFEGYVEDKLSVLGRMKEGDVAFIPQALSTHPLVKGFVGKLYLYEDSQSLAKEFGIDLSKLPFKEPFLLDSVLALCGAEIMCGESRLEAIVHYKVGEHKMQEFFDSQSRVWVDDSKGTNADATIWALRAYKNKKIYLILGGEDKGADLTPLFEEMRGGDIEIFAIGKNASRLQALASEYNIPSQVCDVLERAVKCIHSLHSNESIALLSPAAASLDQFSSYKHRGEEFVRIVKSLH